MSIRKLMQATGLSSLTIERARGPLICRCTLLTLHRIAVALECHVKDLFIEAEQCENTADALERSES